MCPFGHYLITKGIKHKKYKKWRLFSPLVTMQGNTVAACTMVFPDQS